MMRSMVAFLLLISMVPSTRACYGLALPPDAVILVPFAPVGNYAGHWGVDIAAAAGSSVVAVGPGTVSFAGAVAGRQSVTIDHGGAIRTSYSYLAAILVAVGEEVVTGASVGSTGVHDGREAFHLSLRTGSKYLDPLLFGRCSQVPEPALWLAMARHGYPVARDRNSRGHVRPTTHRASCHGSGRLRPTRTG